MRSGSAARLPVDPWQTGRVTLLGDAIHNMTPMAGIGANTALRDADLLRRQLIAVDVRGARLVPAVHEYEGQMRDYGFAAVKQSLQQRAAGRLGQPPWPRRLPHRSAHRCRGAAAAAPDGRLAGPVTPQVRETP